MAIVTVTALHASGGAWAAPLAEGPPPSPLRGAMPPSSPVTDPAPPEGPVYLAPTNVPQGAALRRPPKILDYDDTQPPPLGYTPVLRARKGLIIGGPIAFAASYAICLILGGTGDPPETGSDGASRENGARALLIPFAGPFLQMGHEHEAKAKVLLAGLGGMQLAGAILLATGLSSKKTVLLRNDLVHRIAMLLSGRF